MRTVVILVHHSVSIKVFLFLFARVEDKVGVLVAGFMINKIHEADFFAMPAYVCHPRAFVVIVFYLVSIYILVASISLAIVVHVGLVLVENFWTVVADVSEAVVVGVLLVLVLLVRAVVALVTAIHVVDLI